MNAPRPLRLPLQVGITSLWGLARSASALVPGLFLLLPSAALGIGILLLTADNGDDGSGIVIALAVALTPLLLIPYAFSQVAAAWRMRPSDVFLDPTGLRVVGGRCHGARATWKEMEEQGVSIRHVVDKRWTVKDIFTGNWSANDRQGVPMKWLVLGDSPVPLAEAEAKDEQASLSALLDSIRQGPFSPRRAEEAGQPVTHDDVKVLRCSGCGGIAVPEDRDVVTCRFCNTAVPVSGDARARIRASRLVVAERPRNEQLVQRLLDQPGARRTGFLLGVAGLLMLAAWPSAVVLGLRLHHQQLFVADRVAALALYPWSVIAALYFLVRFQLVDRFALRLLALEFGATAPVREGEPYFCRGCNAPLPDGEGRVVVACGWCSAENVLGVDLRGVARTVKRQAAGLDELLQQRARQRRGWGSAAACSVGLLLLGGWLVRHAVRPLPQTATLLPGSGATHLERVSTDARDERAPRPLAGGRLAFVAFGAGGGEGRVQLSTPGSPEPSLELRGVSGQRLSFDVAAPDRLLAVFSSGARLGELSGAASHALHLTPAPVFVRVSPDGTRVAAVFEGSGRPVVGLLRLDALEAEPQRWEPCVTGDHPAWSPDGTQLAFVREVEGTRQLFSLSTSPGAEPVQLTAGPGAHEFPAWMPDGRGLAFVAGEGEARTVRLLDPQRGVSAPLLSGTSEMTDLAWSPDGWLYLSANAFTRFDLFRVRADGPLEWQAQPPVTPAAPVHAAGAAARNLQRLTRDSWLQSAPAFGPGGALAWGEQVTERDETSHHALAAVRPPSRVPVALVRGDDTARNPAWLGENELVYVQARRGARALVRVDLVTGIEQRLAEAKSLGVPRLSPDGTRLAVDGEFEDGQGQHVAIIELANRALTVLGPGHGPSWRTAESILYATGDKPSRLLEAAASGALEPWPVTEGPYDFDAPTLSPDGEWLLAVSNLSAGQDGGVELRADSANLVARRADGSGPWMQVTTGQAEVRQPTWGPEGRIVYGVKVDGQVDLFQVTWAGPRAAEIRPPPGQGPSQRRRPRDAGTKRQP